MKYLLQFFFSFSLILIASGVGSVQAELQAKKPSLGKPIMTLTKTSRLVFGAQEIVEAPLMAFDQSVVTAKNRPVTIVLTGGIVEKRLGVLSYAIVERPRQGKLSAFASITGRVTYSPNSNFLGEDLFTFCVKSANEKSNPATVKVTVTDQAAPVPFSPPGGGGNIVQNEFLIELNQERDEFLKDQREERGEFFSDVRSKSLSTEELQKRIIEFRAKEVKREQKFSQDQRKKIEKRQKDVINQDETFVGQLGRERSDFFTKQTEERSKFFSDLADDDLSAEERVEKVGDFREDQIKEVTRFLEKHQKAIANIGQFSRERSEFFTNQAQERSKFFSDLADDDLSAEKREKKVTGFREDQVKKAAKFLEKQLKKIASKSQ